MRPVRTLIGFAAAAVCLGLLSAPASPDALSDEEGKVKVQPVIEMKAKAFSLEDVRLLDGPFKRAMELDRKYLLLLDVDRLLHNFRVNAGLPSSAQPLGGWEEPGCELRGHTVGHYMTACALMYASTGDERLKEKGDRVVAGLAECQDEIGTGYLSAYPESFFDRVEARRRVWAPYYTLHKIYAGLLDMYVHCDNARALDVCRKFADWAIARNARLSDEQMEAMLGTEHGGMNEALANLYGVTGEKKYLEISRRFNHKAVIAPAMARRDRLTGLHANTQVPKFIGTARQYELTGEMPLKTASVFFWVTVVNERSYVIGGNSEGEAFSPKERLSEALGPNTTETCNTYNMLKLTRHLFCWEPKAEYADYYERALYNHILASQNPETGMMCYYVPLRSGSRKTYNSENDSFWCCTGTGIENHAKYGDSIYFHDGGNGLFVNLFIASELNWPSKALKIRQETTYPQEGASRLKFTCERPVKLGVHIRYPYWATSGLEISVNGKKQNVTGAPGAYATLSRTWRNDDTVQIRIPFTLRTEGFRDNPRRFAFMHGPLVLCAEADIRRPYPAVVGREREVLAALEPVAGKASTFTGPPDIFRTAGQEGTGVTLEPFYKMHGGRNYIVYWDSFTPAAWKAKEQQYEDELARQKELEARMVDRVEPGAEQNERDHNLRGENTASGDFSGRKWRHATDGGWFSYDVKVLPAEQQELSVTYWGSDGGNRLFDVLIDGTKLATQRLQNNRPGEFYDEIYEIPESLTKGREKVTVKFQAHDRAWAGGIFGLRVLKKDASGKLSEDESTSAARDVTFIVTSDVHYDAFENEDRNERVRDTIRHINKIVQVAWPQQLGGGPIASPRGVLVLGDVIDDGDRIFEGKHQTPRQWLLFAADFGLDGKDGLLDYPVYETWGNHDGPPAGREKHGFSFQAQLQRRNLVRRKKGLVTRVSANGLHCSWDWDDVHLVLLGIYPADRQHPDVRYSAEWHDPQMALTFLKEDLAASVGDSGRPVVLANHCGFDTDWWHKDDWKALYEAVGPYNVVACFYGHSGTGLRKWAPEGEDKPLDCINTGQTENGFFVVQIVDGQMRAAYRCKQWSEEKAPDGRRKRTWNSAWQWRHLLEESVSVGARPRYRGVGGNCLELSVRPLLGTTAFG